MCKHIYDSMNTIWIESHPVGAAIKNRYFMPNMNNNQIKCRIANASFICFICQC